MHNKNISLSTAKYKKEKRIKKFIMISLLVLLLILLILYFTVGIIYNSESFAITLDKNLYYQKGLIVYDDPNYKVFRSELFAKSPETFDNISFKWIPGNINDSNGGSHNGSNYMAYTFFVENTGVDVADYYSELVIEDVIKNVDEAVRIRVYKNDEETTYAKPARNGKPEDNTVPFLEDRVISMDHIADFKPGDIDKYTIVLWIEGSDPECNDNILGGEIKISMNFNSEYVES